MPRENGVPVLSWLIISRITFDLKARSVSLKGLFFFRPAYYVRDPVRGGVAAPNEKLDLPALLGVPTKKWNT
jgi:hypothetical protein